MADIAHENHCSRWSGIPQAKQTDFTRRAVGLLVSAFQTGVYNLPIKWDRVDWRHGNGVSFILGNRPALATWDFNHLTGLVIGAHAECIRVEIEPHGFGYLKINMWPRKGRVGSMMERHPTIEEAIARYRGEPPTPRPNVVVEPGQRPARSSLLEDPENLQAKENDADDVCKREFAQSDDKHNCHGLLHGRKGGNDDLIGENLSVRSKHGPGHGRTGLQVSEGYQPNDASKVSKTTDEPSEEKYIDSFDVFNGRPQQSMRTVAEVMMTAFTDAPPQRDEFNGEQTILTYNNNVGVWDLEFFESGDEFPEQWLGGTHWIDITRMWPGVIAQVASFATTEGRDNG